MQHYFPTLARYNEWANQRLYDACGQLSEADYFKNRQAFFNSIHGTLNHILVGDRLWLGRLTANHSGITALDQQLYADFDSLFAARKQEDKKIIAFFDNFDQTKLQDIFSFTTLAGKPNQFSFMWLFSHLFNHQTHHRGQAHHMLSEAGIAPPPLDIYYFVENIE